MNKKTIRAQAAFYRRHKDYLMWILKGNETKAKIAYDECLTLIDRYGFSL